MDRGNTLCESVNSRPTLPRQVLAQYDLGEIDAVEPKEGGGIDQSFVVTAAGVRYFFICNSNAPDSFNFLILIATEG